MEVTLIVAGTRFFAPAQHSAGEQPEEEVMQTSTFLPEKEITLMTGGIHDIAEFGTNDGPTAQVS